MTDIQRAIRQIGAAQSVVLVAFGIALSLVVMGRLDPLALIILMILAYFTYMAHGVLVQARRVRPVEPPNTWLITMLANLALMALGIGSFGWYIAGGGVMTWVPFLIFVAGMIALRQWRRGVVTRLYAWRTPALTLLRKGEYKKLVRHLEAEATAGAGHPDKLAMVALAYIELNKWDMADRLLARAKQLAPEYASVNGALGSLRRHQARYAEAVEVLDLALAFEDNTSTRYYLGLCQYLAGDMSGARDTLRRVIDDPTLLRQGQVYSAYILGQIAQQDGDDQAARAWTDRMAEVGPKTIAALNDEARRHKQTPYGETLKAHVRAMEQIIARRPLERQDAGVPTDDSEK